MAERNGDGQGEFAHRLRDELRRRGVTSSQLARRVGVSKNTVTSWTRGVHEPSAGHVRRIAEAVGTSAGQLLGEPPGETRKRPQLAHAETPEEGAELLELVRQLAGLRLEPTVAALARAAPDLMQVLREAERHAGGLEAGSPGQGRHVDGE